MTVDTTDCQIQEPTVKGGMKKSGRWLPFNPAWYSHKFKGAGVRYEVAASIQTGDIVWLNGPFPCGKMNDIAIFKSKLLKKLNPGEMVEADGIYRGVEGVRSKGDYFSKSDKKAKGRARARHETENSRFKFWNCASDIWRHHVSKHKIAFTAVVVITQLAFEAGEAPFQCSY